MFEIIRTYIIDQIREMTCQTLTDIRKLELVHDSKDKRIFLSGKLTAYEDILRIIEAKPNYDEKSI